VRLCPRCGSPDVSDEWACDACGFRPRDADGFPGLGPEIADDAGGFDDAFFAELASLEADNFWFRARNELILWALRSNVPRCGRILEIGCGTGFVLSAIRDAHPEAELVGTEIFSRGLGFATTRVPEATFLQMDARSIPFRDEFDVIGAFDVLEHIADDRTVIAEVARALRPGGRFLITVPQHPALWSPQDEVSFHIRRYTADGIRAQLTSAGLEVRRLTSFVTFLLPFMLAARLGMRHQATDSPFEAMSGLRVPRPIDQVLAAVMLVERAFIRRGVSWPAGGSLLIVAAKPAPAGSAP
jgi:SAM-dependent methyltransferase